MRLRQLFESPRTAVMAFGRMNPPTIGHQKLVEKIKSIPGDHYVFLSQSQKPQTDPLTFTDKLRYAKFFFPNVTVGHPEVKTIIQAMQKLSELGYERVIYVAGSDRVDSFTKLLNQYNGQADKAGNVPYSFKLIQVVSAGERDPDADGAEGMSASKMRQAAADNDLESFKQGVPQPQLADEMFAAVRQGMGINDAVPAESISESPLAAWPAVAYAASRISPTTYAGAATAIGTTIAKAIKHFEELIKKNPKHPKVSEVKAELDKLKPMLAKSQSGMAEGWFGFGEGDPIEAPEWLNDENKALWTTKQPTTKDKRLVAQLKKLQRFIQAGLTDQANQVVARELSMMQREGVEEGWFDFSGKEMKQYIEFAQKRMNWYPDARLRQELKKKFPEIKPVDIERTIKQVQGLRQNRAP